VIGGGPAGLEAARVAVLRGHRVTIAERGEHLGGLARVAGPNASLVEWWTREHELLGSDIRLGTPGEAVAVDERTVVIQATGSEAGPRPYRSDPDAVVIDVADLRRGTAVVPDEGTIVIFDPIGGPIAVALAEELGARAVLVTQDNIAGNELARTGDLAPANTRLAQQDVSIERRTLLREVRNGEAEVEDRYSGERRTIACSAVVDCGFRVPTAPIDEAVQIGDAVAPRTIHEAILEARRAAHAI
jgi:2,4-dienoyl-CoA reductase (NADPH2)